MSKQIQDFPKIDWNNALKIIGLKLGLDKKTMSQIRLKKHYFETLLGHFYLQCCCYVSTCCLDTPVVRIMK